MKIEEINKILKEKGYLSKNAPKNKYSEKTTEAVKKYQKDLKIKEDGNWGPYTDIEHFKKENNKTSNNSIEDLNEKE